MRAAQLARALGAHLPGLGEIPAAVEDAYRRRQGDRPVPAARLIEFIGGGINQWTAAEGALKIREAAYVASEGWRWSSSCTAPRWRWALIELHTC